MSFCGYEVANFEMQYVYAFVAAHRCEYFIWREVK